MRRSKILTILVGSLALLAPSFFSNLSVQFRMLSGFGFFLAASVLIALTHELAHYAAARLCGISDAILHISYKKFSVTYHTDSGFKKIAISLAGPLSGISMAAVGFWLAATLSSTQPLAATWIGFVSLVASVQILFLLPFVADGHIIWESAWNLVNKKGT